MAYTREYLEEALRETKQYLPDWLYKKLVASARSRAGGRAAHRVELPSTIEKLALTEIRPNKIKDTTDTELRAVWLRLHQWYSSAKRRKEAVEDIVNAALWVKAEIERRGSKVSASPLVAAIAELEAVKKARGKSVRGERGPLPEFIGRRLDKAPDEILLVRDFVNVAGSAAVTERPNDIDVVVRAFYDAPQSSYMLDGSCMWTALRRFLTPNKRGPQMQMLGSPQGSFTDYIPVYDLVLRRREPHVVKIEPEPPEYKDKQRVIKARAASAEQRAQAERAKREDKLTLGEFFYQPKPTRPAFEEEPQTVDRLLELYEERRDKWLPAWVQKKYDGVRHQIHKNNNEVTIYSEDGDDNTDRLPGVVAAIKQLGPHRLVLDAEIERWKDGQHLPREAVSAYLATKDEPDDSDLVANVFDVLFWKGDDIHQRPLRFRLECLKQLGDAGTMEKPKASERVNIAPGLEVKTVAELKKATERIRRLPGSEGIVAKQIESRYPLALVTEDLWVKFHNATTIKGVVIDSKRVKGGAWVYEFGIAPGKEKAEHYTDGEKLIPVGLTFSTARRYQKGEPIFIEAETVNKVRSPRGVSIGAWAPRVLGDYEGKPDTVDTVVKRAAAQLVLQTKEADDSGKVIEYYPPNVVKTRRPIELNTVGPEKAPIAFVGASPGPVDVARQEPIVGADGATFRDVYLEPFGLRRAQVVLMNVVPELLLDDEGRSREPDAEEIAEWKEWVDEELDRLQPSIVVALGKTAEKALDKRADLTLPHPSAVRRFGDSGEVGRKMKRLQPRIKDAMGLVQKVPKAISSPTAEGGTRSTRAKQNWESSWEKLLPRSGKGKFVYQHHWRGLSEDEIGLSDPDLMKNSDHSVHGDLRFEGEDGLWGFTVFLGRTEDNRGPNLDKLIDWKKDDNIEVTPKLGQPEEWLKVGVGKPYVSPPGEVGATTEKYSKFFERDQGTYELGVARQHMVEIRLDGQHLKGVYLLMLAPVAGQRRWLIDKPENQTPMAKRRDLADVLSELKRKNQRTLVWGVPGEKPRFIDVRTGRIEKGGPVRIRKADEEKRIVYGVVLDPYGKSGPEADAHNDWNPPGEIEKTAHEFAKRSRVIGLQHSKKADAQLVESWVEQYPSRQDYLSALAGQPHRVYRRQFGDDVLHSGAWVMGVELGQEEWKLYKAGKLNAFSPGGVGARRSITEGEMPKVTFIDIVEKPGAS